MRRVDFPRISEYYLEQTLPNGLTIRVVPKPGFARKYAFFATNFGSMDTGFVLGGEHHTTPDGVAHFLEHKMFDLPRGNVMQEFAANGASPNAFTSYDMTAYYFDCTEEFDKNLRLLLEYVSTPYFTAESVEKEQGIIGQEIRMYEDNPASQVYEQLLAALYPGHPVRVPIAGSVESIAQITAELLYDCHRAFYAPSNMCLVVVGDVDPASVVRAAEELLPKERTEIAERDYGTDLCPTGPVVVRREMDVALPAMMLAFRCPAVADRSESMKSEIVGDLAAELLAGEASPLYTRLYEEGLIDGSFSVGYETMRGGIQMLLFSGDSCDPEAVRDAIIAEAARIGREGADAALFERLKRSAVGRRYRDLDSFESVCYRMCSYFFDGVDSFAFPEAYDRVHLKDALELLANQLTIDNAVLSVIEPRHREDEAHVL